MAHLANPHHSVLPATRALASLAAGLLAAAGVLLVLAWLGIVGVEFFALAFASAVLIALFTIMPKGIMDKEIEDQQRRKCASKLNFFTQADFKSRKAVPAAPPPRTPPAI